MMMVMFSPVHIDILSNGDVVWYDIGGAMHAFMFTQGNKHCAFCSSLGAVALVSPYLRASVLFVFLSFPAIKVN